MKQRSCHLIKREERETGGGRKEERKGHVVSCCLSGSSSSRTILCVILMCTSHYAKRSPTELSFQKCCFSSAQRGVKAPRRCKMWKHLKQTGWWLRHSRMVFKCSIAQIFLSFSTLLHCLLLKKIYSHSINFLFESEQQWTPVGTRDRLHDREICLLIYHENE